MPPIERSNIDAIGPAASACSRSLCSTTNSHWLMASSTSRRGSRRESFSGAVLVGGPPSRFVFARMGPFGGIVEEGGVYRSTGSADGQRRCRGLEPGVYGVHRKLIGDPNWSQTNSELLLPRPLRELAEVESHVAATHVQVS